MSHHLNILGANHLSDARGAAVSSVLQQPRRFALLVYLALSNTEDMIKRDTLLGMFWPDMTEENGRRALSQAIHFLRRSLGQEAILTRGNDDVAINRTLIQCDAAQFLAAARDASPSVAVAMYNGDLLPGFIVSGAQDFDNWLSGSRERLRRIAADVFLRAAEEAKQQNDLVTAAANGHRCAQLVA
ncbi:MAG: AfsR/SARP family transcriptional regulator, partial [Gemmatimonadota bacterium]